MTFICNKCHIEKESIYFYKQERNRSGHMYQCKSCMDARGLVWNNNNYEKVLKNGRKNDKKNRNKRRIRKYVARYGITDKDRTNMVIYQNGLCVICKKISPRLVIDHCHITNKVRGLLCDGYNLGLGGFKDNPVLMIEAIEYLKRTSDIHFDVREHMKDPIFKLTLTKKPKNSKI